MFACFFTKRYPVLLYVPLRTRVYQVAHSKSSSQNIVNYQQGKHCCVPFVCFKSVQDGEIEVVLFQKCLLAVTDCVTLSAMMKGYCKFLQPMRVVDPVGPFFLDTAVATKRITTKNYMYLLFALIGILNVKGQNLTCWASICTIVPGMPSLGLKYPQLTNFMLVA